MVGSKKVGLTPFLTSLTPPKSHQNGLQGGFEAVLMYCPRLRPKASENEPFLRTQNSPQNRVLVRPRDCTVRQPAASPNFV